MMSLNPLNQVQRPDIIHQELKPVPPKTSDLGSTQTCGPLLHVVMTTFPSLPLSLTVTIKIKA